MSCKQDKLVCRSDRRILIELPNFCFKFRPTIIRGIYESKSWRNLQIVVIIIHILRSGSVPWINVVQVQVLPCLEQRIQERTEEVSHEIHTNQSSPSWNLDKICTSLSLHMRYWSCHSWWLGDYVNKWSSPIFPSVVCQSYDRPNKRNEQSFNFTPVHRFGLQGDGKTGKLGPAIWYQGHTFAFLFLFTCVYAKNLINLKVGD